MPRGAPLGAPSGFMIEKEPPRKVARRLLNSFSLTSFDTVSRGRDRARSGNFPTTGNFQVRKWSKPHRGFAKKALAHPQRGSQGKALAHPEEAKMCSALQPSRLTSFGNLSAFGTVSRGSTRARSGTAPNNRTFPSSQAAKSPPGPLQESACSPPKRRLCYGFPKYFREQNHAFALRDPICLVPGA